MLCKRGGRARRSVREYVCVLARTSTVDIWRFLGLLMKIAYTSFEKRRTYNIAAATRRHASFDHPKYHTKTFIVSCNGHMFIALRGNIQSILAAGRSPSRLETRPWGGGGVHGNRLLYDGSYVCCSIRVVMRSLCFREIAAASGSKVSSFWSLSFLPAS